MPYVSKYYSGPEIDERLKQGYYDDIVEAGFVGTLREFLTFILSINDKVGSDTLKDTVTNLTKLIEDTEATLKNSIKETQDSIPIKVSQLENDSLYQTQKDVEDTINKLVDGAGDALDTLKELADALNNDPNFATTITNLITSVKDKLIEEIDRAKEVEAQLKSDLQTETTARTTEDQAIRDLIETNRASLATTLQTALQEMHTHLEEFHQSILDITQQHNDYKLEVNGKFDEVNQSIHILEDKVEASKSEAKAYTDTKVKEEADRAKAKEEEISEALNEFKTQTATNLNDISNRIVQLDSDIKNEATIRQSEDAKLQSAIQEEAVKRASDKTELLAKLSEEVNARTTGDANLQAAISSEVSTREQEDLKLKGLIESEVTNRTNEDNLIKQDILHNKELTDSDIKKVSDDLASEVSRATEIENGKVDKKEGYGLSKNDFTDELLSKLNSISDHANNVTKVSELINDSGFQTRAEVDQAIQDVIGAAPDALNTLKELADALNNDPNFAGNLTTQLSQLGTQLNQEVADRKAQKEEITTAYTQAIRNAVTELNASYTVLSNSLETAKTTLSKDISDLQTDISDLEASVEDAVNQQNTAIQNVRKDLVDNTNALNTAITDLRNITRQDIASWASTIQENTAAIQRNLELIQQIQGQITSLDNNIIAAIKLETEQRKAEDDKLQAAIDTVSENLRLEIITREQADNTLQTNINNEATTRQNEDAKLQAKITELKAALDAEKAAREDLAQEFEDYKANTLTLFNDLYNIIKK